MKVGEYARLNNTLYGTTVILKIMEVYDNTILTENDGSIFQGEYGKDEIINHSYNIIDLIEVGDYVNGCLVTNKRASVNERLSGHPKQIFILKQEGNYYDGHFEWLGEEDIKSIVTKEVYASVEYRVETD